GQRQLTWPTSSSNPCDRCQSAELRASPVILHRLDASQVPPCSIRKMYGVLAARTGPGTAYGSGGASSSSTFMLFTQAANSKRSWTGSAARSGGHRGRGRTGQADG